MLFIKVPATTANIGPGFDAMGIALNLFNSIEIEKSESKSFDWNNTDVSLSEKENLIIQSLEYTLKKCEFVSGYAIKAIEMDIPVSRGLGSSAASVVLGILCANYLMNYKLNDNRMLEIANELEGHPDNVAPALFGGMITSVVKDNKVYSSNIKVPELLKFMVTIPNFKLSTDQARAALPSSYSRADCVFNISRAALLISSLVNSEFENLRVALDDKIHQSYRLALINFGKEYMDHSQKNGSLGEFISGAGPTMISLINEDEETFINNMKNFFNDNDLVWDIKSLTLNTDGYQIMEV
jgi:homoserine kinase